MKLSELGEFGLIDRIAPGCTVNAEHVIKGIGDDCSVTRGSRDTLRLVTTDLLIERVHFLRDTISARQLGAKALAVNLSDIAAMGGRALDAYISLAIPDGTTIEYIDELYTGMKGMAARFSVNLLGGDTTGSKQDLVINVAVVGKIAEADIVYRHGAKPGDRIYVTGSLGDSAGGLDAILCGRTGSAPELTRRHLEPLPHLAQGQRIAATGSAHAMVDVSDGLTSDLGHICDQSGVGCVVETNKLPISPELANYCKEHGIDPINLALSGGEDYVLLVTGSSELTSATDMELAEVGHVVEGNSRVVKKPGGATIPLTRSGWDHIRST